MPTTNEINNALAIVNGELQRLGVHINLLYNNGTQIQGWSMLNLNQTTGYNTPTPAVTGSSYRDGDNYFGIGGFGSQER